MNEVVPIVFAFALGIVVWRYANGRSRLILSCCAVAISGLTATMLSGEFRESWIFLFLDLGEAAFGLAVGTLVAHRLLRPSVVRGRRFPTSG